MRLMVQSEMPLILYWLADRSALRGADAMFVAFLPIWQALAEADDDVRLLQQDFPSDPGVGGLLACAYDMFTREGQMALARFIKHPPIDAALQLVQPNDRTNLLHAAVFIAEGGQLNLRVSLPELDAVHRRAIDCELTYFGAAGEAAQTALIRAVMGEIEVLNRYRMRIGSKTFAAKIEASETAKSIPQTLGPYTHPQQALPLYDVPKLISARSPPILPDREFWGWDSAGQKDVHVACGVGVRSHAVPGSL